MVALISMNKTTNFYSQQSSVSRLNEALQRASLERQMSRHVCLNWRHKNIFSTSSRIENNSRTNKKTTQPTQRSKLKGESYVNAIFYISRRIKYFINMNVCVVSCMQCIYTHTLPIQMHMATTLLGDAKKKRKKRTPTIQYNQCHNTCLPMHFGPHI